jgi:hypothetical protein
VTRRAARFTQCDLERALRAVDAHRARTGAAWRVCALRLTGRLSWSPVAQDSAADLTAALTRRFAIVYS